MIFILLSATEAHVSDLIGGIDVDPRTGDVVVEASFGLLLPQPEGYDWVCHEAITEPGVIRSPRYARAASGALLGFLPDPLLGRGGSTLFRSADGCDWPAVPIEGVATGAVFAAEGFEALVVTESPGSILTSTNDGATFAVSVSAPDRAFLSVLHAGSEAWATATTPGGWWLWHRDALGVWSERALTLPPGVADDAQPKLLAAGAPGEVWVLFEPFGADTIVRATVDGPDEVAWQGGSLVSDGAWDGERLWFVRDGAFLSSIGPDGLTDHAGYPLGISIATDAAGVLWTAPQAYLVSSMLSRSLDGGASFETVAYPDDVVETKSCPADSDVAEVCAPLWSVLLPRIRGFDDPPPVDTGDGGPPPVITPRPDTGTEAPGGCGCGSGVDPSIGAGLLLLALTSRARGAGAARRPPALRP